MELSEIISVATVLGIALLLRYNNENRRQNYIEKRLYEIETKLLTLGLPEDKTSFSVFLTKVPSKQGIATIKALRSLDIGTLKELKEMVENPPRLIKAEISKEEAFAIRDALYAAQAEVDIL